MNLQEKKNGFLLYKSQYEAIKDFSEEKKGKLLDRIFQYQLGNESFLSDDGEVELAFRFFKIQFDFDGVKYEEFLKKQRENGLKGGRKRGEQIKEEAKRRKTQKTQANPPLENTDHNENEKENEKEKEKVNEKKKLPKAIVSGKKPKILKAKKVSGGGEKGGFGDPAINDIVETIKKHHKTIDGTQKEARHYGMMLRDKIDEIEGFNGDYKGFIDNLILKASKFTKRYTTSPKNIYYKLGEIMASEEQPQSKIKTPPRRVQEEEQKQKDHEKVEESQKIVDEKNELRDYWETLGVMERQTIIQQAMKNARENNPNTKEEFLKPMITGERNKILKERLGKK